MNTWTPYCCVSPYPDKMAKNSSIKSLETSEKRNEDVSNLTTLNNGKTVLSPPEMNGVSTNLTQQIMHDSAVKILNHINGNHITTATNGHHEINGQLDQIKNSELSSKDTNTTDDTLSVEPPQAGSDIATKLKTDVLSADNIKSVDEDSSDKTKITNDNDMTDVKVEELVDNKPSDSEIAQNSEISKEKKSQEGESNATPQGLLAL